MKVQAFLVSGEFRVHRAGCQDTAREARRSDWPATRRNTPARPRSSARCGPTSSRRTRIPTARPAASPPWKPRPGSWPAPGGCPMNNPVPGPAGPGVPPGGTGTPRGEGDGIAVEVPTRARPGHGGVHRAGARAGLPGRARLHLPGPPVRRQRVPGRPRLAGHGAARAVAVPGRAPCRPGRRGGDREHHRAGVAAWLRDHPEILDLAAQARARAGRARARRDLELLTAEITAAEQQLDGLRRKQERLQAIASGSRDEPPGPAALLPAEDRPASSPEPAMPANGESA